MQGVQVWEACALSLNVDPDSITISNDIMGCNQRIDMRSFPSAKAWESFEKRIRLRAANRWATVALAEFVSWALTQSTPWDMPPEMVALANKPDVRAGAPAYAEIDHNNRSAMGEESDAVEAMDMTSSGKSPEGPNPWLVPHPGDPNPDHDWYTPARYLARKFVSEDSTLLAKRQTLASKVAKSLKHLGYLKRGGRKPFAGATVLKAFSNVIFN